MTDARRLAHARSLLELDRPAEAEQLLRDVLAGDPGCAAAMQELAVALHHQQRDAEAEEVARRAVAMAPEDCYAHLVLNDICCATGQVEGAMQSAQQTLRLAPHAWTSHYAMARALLTGRRPRTHDAYQSAVRAVELAPNHPSPHTLVGLCLEGLTDLEGAERAYRNALAIDPHHTNAQNNLASLQMRRGRLGAGAAMLKRAVGQAPQERVLHESLDTVLLLLGRRVLWSLIAAGIVLGILLAQEAPWAARAAAGVAYVATLAFLVRRFGEHLPRGVSRWGRGTFARAHWRGKYLLGLLALLSLAILLLAFAPHQLAVTAGITLLMVLRVLGIVCVIGWVVLAAVNLVRGR